MAENFNKIPYGISNHPGLASDPSGGVAGDWYFNNVTETFRFFNGSTWNNVGAGAAAYPDGTVLSGTYTSDVFVLGSASMGADVIIQGDLITSANLTNSIGSSLTVKGNLNVVGTFNFTPSSTVAPQGNVNIGGDFNFQTAAEFRANPGQSPVLTVNGNMNGSWNGPTVFTGTGSAPGASGLTINIAGGAYNLNIDVSGADADSSNDAGNGGSVFTAADFTDSCATGNGGNSSVAGKNPGNGGTILLFTGDLIFGTDGPMSFRGGNATASGGTGGQGGTVNVSGDLIWGNGTITVDVSGGDGDAQGGNGGEYRVSGDTGIGVVVHNNGGSSANGQGGNGGDFANLGPVYGSIYATGGDGRTNGGNGSSVGGSHPTIFCGESLYVAGGVGTIGNGGSAGSVFFATLIFNGSSDGLNISGGAGGTTNGADGSVTTLGDCVINTGKIAGHIGGDFTKFTNDVQVVGNLVVGGDLNCPGNFTNNGGFSLSVGGDLRVAGNFNFTPSNTSTSQGNVTIGGDCMLGSNSSNAHQFMVNPGQAPVFSIGGDLTFPNGNNSGSFPFYNLFNGSGVAGTGANGLTLTVFGNILEIDGTGNEAGSSIFMDGADSSTGNAGNGGVIYVAGDISWLFFRLNGGNSTFAGANGGAGGTIEVAGDAASINYSLNGGSAGTGGHGGNGGLFHCWATTTHSNPCSADGGDNTDGTGFAGNGGSVVYYGAVTVDFDQTVSANGGAGPGRGGNGGSIEAFGYASFNGCNLSASGGAGNGGRAGNGGTVFLHAGGTFQTLSVAGGDCSIGNFGGNGGSLTSGGSILNTAIVATGGHTVGGTPGDGGHVEIHGDYSGNSGTGAINADMGDASGGSNGTITIFGDFYHPGSWRMSGTTSVSKIMKVDGDLFNGDGVTTGGYQLTVGSNLTITGALNFTPITTTLTQSNINIGGSLRIGANSEFKVNPGQSPSLLIGGDWFWPDPMNSFSGVGQPGANGLTITVGGDLIKWFGDTIQIFLDGGDDSVSAPGNGGSLNISGDVSDLQLSAVGGPASHAGHNAGTGGQLFIGGDFNDAQFTLDGGAASVSGVNAGNGGSAFIVGDCGGTFASSANGGACTSSAGNGGAGGSIVASGSLMAAQGGGQTYSANGGNSSSASGGNGGSLYFNGAANMTLNVSGGTGSTVGGNGGTITSTSALSVNSINIQGGSGATSGSSGSVSFGGSCTTSSTITIAGTVAGDLISQNRVTLIGDLVVYGDLITFANSFFNNVGANLIVTGDVRVSGTFNFTPTDPNATQGNVDIGGDFIFGSDSEFHVNKGQSPFITIGGKMNGVVFGTDAINGANTLIFDGSGNQEAPGLRVNVGGDVNYVDLRINGGDSAGVADAGNGGICLVNGNGYMNFSSLGGNSGFSGFNAGKGGQISLGNIQVWNNINMDGGSVTTGSGNGGDGGKCVCYSIGGFSGAPAVTAQGGNAGPTGGNGGAGGFLSFCSAFDISFLGAGGNASIGNGGPGGQFLGSQGSLGSERGSFFGNTIDLSGGNTVTGHGGNAGGFGDTLIGDLNADRIKIKGGSVSAAGDAGTGGSAFSASNITVRTVSDTSGGNSVSGAGGNAGAITARNFYSDGNVFLIGGSGTTTSGNGGNVSVGGDFYNAGDISVFGGTTGTPGSNGRVFTFGTYKQKFTKTFSDLSAVSTSHDIDLVDIGMPMKIRSVTVKHSTSFAGGTITAYNVSIGQTANLDRFSDPFDVFQTVSDSNYQSTIEGVVNGFSGFSTDVRLSAVSTGDTLNHATQGSVDIWLEISGLN